MERTCPHCQIADEVKQAVTGINCCPWRYDREAKVSTPGRSHQQNVGCPPRRPWVASSPISARSVRATTSRPRSARAVGCIGGRTATVGHLAGGASIGFDRGCAASLPPPAIVVVWWSTTEALRGGVQFPLGEVWAQLLLIPRRRPIQLILFARRIDDGVGTGGGGQTDLTDRAQIAGAQSRLS